MKTEITIALPESYTRPAGYSAGAHWSEPGRSGFYLVRDEDGEAIRVQARPDLVEVDEDEEDFATGDPRQVTPEEVEAAIAEAFREHDRQRLAHDDLVLVETMPEHLRATHEAARNRGVWPHNGAERFLVPRAAAVELVEADHEWSEIVRDAEEEDLAAYPVRRTTV